MSSNKKNASLFAIVMLMASMLSSNVAKAATPANITVNASDDYGKIPLNILGKCYSESGVGLTDVIDQNQIANLGRDCLIKRWGKKNVDVSNRASRLLRTLAGSTPGTYEQFYQMITAHKNDSGEKFEYLEFVNEPEGWKMTDDVVYSSFKAAYTAAYDYNKKARPVVPVKVGGPAVFRGNYLTSIERFLDRYKEDSDPKKSLGFISCHLYGDLIGFSNSKLRTLKSDIVNRLKARGLPTDIPIFITESSCFGGSRFQDSESADMLKQASYMATRDYYLVKHGFTEKDANFHWTTRNTSNARKCMLDYPTKESPKSVGPGIATPYLNMLKMQLMLKSNRIYDGESNNDGWGMNCFATKDETGMAAMLINCQEGSSPNEFDAKFTINNLSATVLNGKKIRVEKYLIDSSHNHCRNGYDGKVLEKLSDQVIDFSESYSTTERIGKNAIALIVLSPAASASKIPRN